MSCPDAGKVLNIWEPHLSFLIHGVSIYLIELFARTKQESACQRLQAQMPLGPIKSAESGRMESTAPFYLLIDFWLYWVFVVVFGLFTAAWAFSSCHNWGLLFLAVWRMQWQPTPVLLPGESQGGGSLVGCHLWGHTESTRLKQLSSSSSSFLAVSGLLIVCGFSSCRAQTLGGVGFSSCSSWALEC